MKILVYKEGMSDEESKNIGYWERNVLALQFALFMNDIIRSATENIDPSYYPCGWYNDTDNNWDGWKRVISINNGTITFHIPDDFDIGNLPQIEPNWDGHTTRDKWKLIMENCGCKIDSED